MVDDAGSAFFAMKSVARLFTVIVILALAGVAVWVKYFQQEAPPAVPIAARAEETPPAPARPVSAPAPATRGSDTRERFPSASRDTNQGALEDEAQYKDAFVAHPRTKIAEKRINDLKNATKAFLEHRWTSEYQSTIQKWQQAKARSQDATLTETERAAAEAEVNALTAQASEIEQEQKEFRDGMTAFLQRMVLAERSSILEEVKNPPPPADPKTMTPASERALDLADGYFALGDFQLASTTLAPVLETLPEAERTTAQWKSLLSQMIAGQDTAPTLEPLLYTTTSPALYALGAWAIQQGAWDDAQIWLDQAATSGDASENTAFNQPLIQLGWMDAETGKLIPPPEIEATPATSLPPNR